MRDRAGLGFLGQLLDDNDDFAIFAGARNALIEASVLAEGAEDIPLGSGVVSGEDPLGLIRFGLVDYRLSKVRKELEKLGVLVDLILDLGTHPTEGLSGSGDITLGLYQGVPNFPSRKRRALLGLRSIRERVEWIGQNCPRMKSNTKLGAGGSGEDGDTCR